MQKENKEDYHSKQIVAFIFYMASEKKLKKDNWNVYNCYRHLLRFSPGLFRETSFLLSFWQQAFNTAKTTFSDPFNIMIQASSALWKVYCLLGLYTCCGIAAEIFWQRFCKIPQGYPQQKTCTKSCRFWCGLSCGNQSIK